MRSLVEGLVDWVYNTTNKDSVVMDLSMYLMTQGERTFGESRGELGSTLGNPNTNCLQLAGETNSVGWNYLLGGRMSKQPVSFARACLSETLNPVSPEG
jgi:hypothetical protein